MQDSDNMRITFVLNALERIGGVRVVLEYANYLQKMHHDVSVVYPAVFIPLRARSSVIDHIWAAGDSLVHTLWNRINKGRAQPFKTDISLIKIPFIHPRFAAQLERFIPDADVIIATAWETAYTVNTFSKRTGEKFYLIQSYEIWDVWDNVECWDEAGRIRKGDNTRALAMADVIPAQKGLKRAKDLVDSSFKLPLRKITIAGWLKRLIEEKFGERVEGVIPNGVNLNIFFKERDRPEEPEPVNILMPFRPALLKGFKDGLEAFELIKARHPDAHFALFGPPIKKELQNLPEWVEFHNIKSDAQLRALYNDTHIFILPSWIEGFPLPPMEAMACGCALVTTDAGGLLDYLEDGKTALVVPIRDPAALARSVCKLIEDAHERRRIAENGYRLIRQFTWERAAKELEALLQTAE